MKRFRLPELTEQQAQFVVAAVALVLAAALARLIWGPDVVDLVYGGFILWLLADRVALHDRADETLELAERARGPIAPKPEPEPWTDAPPAPLPPVRTSLLSGPPAPHPFPPRPAVDKPAPSTPETPEQWLARIDAEHQAAMDRISAIGTPPTDAHPDLETESPS